MKLVDTDADRPDDEAEPAPAVTSPVPEKRRATASLLLTLVILTSTVVTIYTVFPARRDELAATAIAEHRRAAPEWQLTAPDARELSVWTMALLGAGAPVPAPDADLAVIGVRPIDVLDRRGALLRYRVAGAGAAAGDEVSLVIHRARDVPPRRKTWKDGAEVVESWRAGGFTCVAIGPAASADTWRPKLGVP